MCAQVMFINKEMGIKYELKIDPALEKDFLIGTLEYWDLGVLWVSIVRKGSCISNIR